MSSESIIHLDDEVSIKELIIKGKQVFYFILKQWRKILIAGIIGGLIGFYYAYTKPINYNAKLSFVVEEGKSVSGGLAAFAGQLGLDVGGSNSSGLLYGENLLLFLKSNNLAKETLLTPFDSLKKTSLADRYADVYKLREQWSKNRKIRKDIFFPINNNTYTRLQDSLLQGIVSQILKKELSVDRPEKKATFIVVQTLMKDELLSKLYCERLVQKATEIYVQSKIKRQKINVERLQKRCDSIEAILNNKTFVNATDQEKILDINPAERRAIVSAELSSRDKIMLLNIYGEIMKNLEIAKIQLSQETPTIQIVDTVSLPLPILKISKLISIIIGGFFASLILVFYLVIKKIISN